MSPAVVVVPCAYLLGTFPAAQLVGGARGHDPTREGSGNPGASNVYRLAGRRAGATVFALDLVKGAVATGVGYALDGRSLAMACGVAAVLGHIVPVTRRFRGGKGVATAAGVTVVLWPLAAIVGAAVWTAVAVGTDTASLASLAGAVAIPLAVAVTGRPAPEVVVALALAALVVLRHGSNIRRLLEGHERGLR
ncbi:MAG TPA: glycerol-3-phosphate 1-O-acyltransferase PlsY [Acidimicrobiales bacterium]|nr:glycerol-3-phosphate 1-O-acyltransferase PlsY [Acidimicrobiales bacterium]